MKQKREGKESERERERQRQVKQKPGTTHGSHSVLLVFLHPGLLDEGVPSSFKTFHYLKILVTKAIPVHWLNSSWFQMLDTCCFLDLNPKFSTNLHRGTGSFLHHSNAIKKQKNRRCRHKEIGQVQHVPWLPVWSKNLW